MSDDLTLTIDGKVYAGWTHATITRGLDRMASHFDIRVTERWAGQGVPWQIAPFAPVTVRLGNDLVLTGYVDSYQAEFDAERHSVRIEGRSKTEDLIDCAPDIKSGQFNGYTLGQIARALCALFGIAVVEETATTNTFADATMERCETAYQFLERLCRLSAVLACDDEQGRLVLTTAGATRAPGRLVQGENILSARGGMNVAKRFSDYIVKGQAGIGGASGVVNWGGAGGIGTAGPAAGASVQTGMHAAAHDAGVPRFRPHTTLAESQLTQAGMQLRANWERQYALGRSIMAHIRLAGWRQPGGALWRINQLVSCQVPFLALDQDLLIVMVTHSLDPLMGRITELGVGPVEGYTPDPGAVKLRKHKGSKGGKGAVDWSGAGGH